MNRSKQLFAIIVLVLAFATGGLQAQPGKGGAKAAGPKPIWPDVKPVLSIDDLKKVKIPNTTINSVTQDADGSLRITATVTHPPENDKVQVFIGLPAKWNGRFQGTGGGGWSGGSAKGVSGPMSQGFAAGATDTGHTGGGSFGLDAKGELAWQLIKDNAYEGIHDMTVVGKALTAAYYGKAPKYSYFVGASTGGRQGLSEAQRFPDDYDGIVSGCPAINWDKLHVAQLWPQLVMNTTKNRLSPAKLSGATKAFIAACDEIDGVKDGLVEDPSRCAWDPKVLVGKDVGGGAITEADADVLRKIWEGPRAKDGSFLWYGPSKGADLSALGGAQPFGITMEWFRYFLTKNPKWDIKQLTPDEYERLFHHSVKEFGEVFGTRKPDLAKFRDRGGKVIIMHGHSDQLIMAEGTVHYYKEVMEKMGGRDKTMTFARLFLIPGAGHGNGGVGNGAVDAVIKWVEDGVAPEKLINRTGSRTRPLFPYPELARYKGTGSTDDEASFERYMPK
jgi:pimeloyl-ACP methyl ester carboxylesterase